MFVRSAEIPLKCWSKAVEALHCVSGIVSATVYSKLCTVSPVQFKILSLA